MRNEEKRKATQKRWYAKNRTKKLIKNRIWMKENREYRQDYARRRNLKKVFGITVEHYNKMFLEQDGNCAICGMNQSQFAKRLYVDHNHRTNKVRGLLCVNCNMLIGHARENEEILKKSIAYLKQYEVHRD